MKRSKSLSLTVAGLVLGILLARPTTSLAGPNLMAIADYGDIPYRRAVAKEGYSGKEIIYRFDDTDFDFGHVVVRSSEPNSVIRRDLFVGFTGDALSVDTRGVGGVATSVRIDEIEIWLRIQGKIRPGQSYEWEVEVDAANEIADTGFPAVIPALWADGEPIGVEVTVRTPELEDTDRIQRLMLPHGAVKIKPFNRQTGGAWVVLRPGNYGAFFAVRRFSFREVDTPESLASKTDMPIPVRYVPIRSVLEDGVAEALERGAEALKEAQGPEHYWPGGNPEENVRLTALAVSALAELDPESDALLPAMRWLSEQEPSDDAPWGTETAARRLYCLARHGGLDKFTGVIHADARFLTDAQFEDGGWSDRSRGEQPEETAHVNSDNANSATVLSALREARFARAEIDKRLWRRVLLYWTDAQAFDGGFREKLERHGGVGQAPTSAYTALGAAALITSLDMAAGFGGRRCTTYLGSRNQLQAIERALGWLDKNYKEPLSSLGSMTVDPDPYAEAKALQVVGEVSGLSHFNEKDHFAESARTLLQHYDRQSRMFGVRGAGQSWAESPSILRTARALSILGAGAAPTVCQRIIAGEDEDGRTQYNGDVVHLVRYLGAQRGRPFNWRRTTIDRDVRELVEVPIMLLSVVGPFDWSKEQWDKIREYCLAGGSVVIDITEGQEAQRKAVISALQRTFPEYRLEDLPPDSPIFSSQTQLSSPPAVQALGNGFRQFLFLPAESWSCQWHLYQVVDHEDSFALMNNLLTYATDGTPPRSSFERSTYAVGSIPAHLMKAAHLEVGSDLPAYPNLIDTMDRLMQANFRLGVTETSSPSEADILWVSVTGKAVPSETAQAQMLDAVGAGRYLFMDVVSGRRDWDENTRGFLQGLEGITLEKLRRTHPIYTGEIPGTQGFEVVQARLRRVLHTRFATSGRCDLYSIRWKGEPVGVYSAYDISSGIGYHYYPKCRGVMPKHARRLAMNAFLTAYQRKVSGQSTH